MMARHSPDWIDAWMAFDLLEPIGQRALWNQLALVLQNLWHASEAKDWMPGCDPDKL